MKESSWFKSLQSNHRLLILIVVVVMCASAGCVYMKMSPPADADKFSPSPDNSCYLATASNMLAGAGYGNGATVQARADDIYQEMIAQFGVANTGWTDTALSWWLSSANNIWPANPYTVVTVYETRIPNIHGQMPMVLVLLAINCVNVILSV